MPLIIVIIICILSVGFLATFIVGIELYNKSRDCAFPTNPICYNDWYCLEPITGANGESSFVKVGAHDGIDNYILHKKICGATNGGLRDPTLPPSTEFVVSSSGQVSYLNMPYTSDEIPPSIADDPAFKGATKLSEINFDWASCACQALASFIDSYENEGTAPTLNTSESSAVLGNSSSSTGYVIGPEGQRKPVQSVMPDSMAGPILTFPPALSYCFNAKTDKTTEPYGSANPHLNFGVATWDAPTVSEDKTAAAAH